MDSVINHTGLPNLCGQAPVDKSTQTDPDAETSGSLGPYEVSRVDADEVITFTGCLPDREITIEKGRVVVKIHPALNVAAQDEEGNSKSFSIRFHSLPVNQAASNVTEDEVREHLDWDGYAACANLYNTRPISVNTARESQISRDSGVDTHSAAHIQSATWQSALSAMSEGSMSSDDSVAEGLAAGSGSASTLSSLDRDSRHSFDSFSGSLNAAPVESISRPLNAEPVGSASGSSKPDSLSPFVNGQRICEAAEVIRESPQSDEPVSRLFFSKLITYDPDKPPAWYKKKYGYKTYYGEQLRHSEHVKNFILSSFGDWLGRLDTGGSGKGINIFNSSKSRFSSKFLFWLEHNTKAFESICEAAQPINNVRRHLNRFFRGEIKTENRAHLYQNLAFKQCDKATIKCLTRNGDDRFIEDCTPAIYFYFRYFISKIEEVSASEKYQAGRDKIARKIANYTALEEPRGDFGLLKACANYNAAVQLFEREYKSTRLAEFDPKRREHGNLIANINYSRVAAEDLQVIRQLLFLIEVLEEEGRGIISKYQKSINGLPATVQGNSFEERVLQMFDNGNGYVSRPLQGIKTTLDNLLANHPDNQRVSPD